MSVITTVVIMFDTLDEEIADREISKLHVWSGWPPRNVSQNSGGPKVPSDVWVCGCNHLAAPEVVVREMATIKWQYPSQVVILFQKEQNSVEIWGLDGRKHKFPEVY